MITDNGNDGDPEPDLYDPDNAMPGDDDDEFPSDIDLRYTLVLRHKQKIED